MATVEKLIEKFSSNLLSDFIYSKISSYTKSTENFEHILEKNSYANFSDLVKIGEATFSNQEDLLVFTCKFQGILSERNSKKQQFEIAKKVLKDDFKDGAIFVFYDDSGCFRFSFLRRNYGNQEQKYSSWKRYTYFIDPNQTNKTFKNRINSCDFSSLDAIQEAFSVEKLKNEFYKELFKWYLWAKEYTKFPNDTNEEEDKHLSESLIRFISRLLFVWFMKEKKLIPYSLFNVVEIKNILKDFNPNSNTNVYYKAILQNLFFATLNVPIEERKWIDGKKRNKAQQGDPLIYRYEKEFIDSNHTIEEIFMKIPFLNGGLFDCLDDRKNDIFIDGFTNTKKYENKQPQFSNFLFFGEYQNIDLSNYFQDENATEKNKWKKQTVTGIIDLLHQYNFTVEENTPAEVDVALDPELLGKVFENLLASFNPETKATARKQTGSFYTPREIVNYMVEESLKQHLKTHIHNHENQIDHLFKNEVPNINDELKKQIVNVLFECKILDPACGSGAYPMGVLHKMVELMTLLDKDNKFLKETEGKKLDHLIQSAKQLTDAQTRNKTIEALQKQKEILQNAEYDYVRKLYIIENCIYGVDIQPIAIQISKLRFFISLLVEQNKNENQQNYGIEPLPNMDFKLVAANTLIAPPQEDKAEQTGLFAEQDNFFETFESLAHDYFTLHTPETKKAKKEEIKKLIQEKVNEKKQSIKRNEEAHTLNGVAKNKQSAQTLLGLNNSKELWESYPNLFKEKAVGFFETPYFFPKVKNGFDIVIGNPPYVNVEKIDKSIKDRIANFKTAYQKYDLYVLFYEKSLDLLKQKGILNFITSNKFLSQGYGLKLRQLFLENKLIEIINFNYDIFETATVRTCILHIQKEKSNDNILKIIDVNDKNDNLKFQNKEYQFLNQQIFNDTDENNFRINLTIEKVELLKKLEKNTLRVDEICSVNYGLRPVSLIEGNDKYSFIKKEFQPNYKKYFEGKDTGNWSILSNNFLDYKKDEIYNPMFEELFENPKLAGLCTLSEINKLRFIYDIDGCYCNHSLAILTLWHLFENVNYSTIKRTITKEKIETSKKYSYQYLQGILNSKMIKFYVNELLYDGTHFYPNHMKQLPIKILNFETQQPFITLVDEILERKKQNLNTTALENKIDIMVYKLYALTYEEVKVVDPEFVLSEEAYNNYVY